MTDSDPSKDALKEKEFKQEMAVGIILNPVLIEFLEFDECIIRWN